MQPLPYYTGRPIFITPEISELRKSTNYCVYSQANPAPTTLWSAASSPASRTTTPLSTSPPPRSTAPPTPPSSPSACSSSGTQVNYVRDHATLNKLLISSYCIIRSRDVGPDPTLDGPQRWHGRGRAENVECEWTVQKNPEAESQKRVWICMDLYGSVRISFSSANSGSHMKIQNIDFYIWI